MHLSTFLLCLQFYLILVDSKSIIRSLPGYHGDLPFKLETGYIGVGEKKDVQLFYYFLESTRNPKEDPLLLYIPGGPGASGLVTFLYEIGPLRFDPDNGPENVTLILNPNTWTKMANILFIDIPVGTGFSYAKSKEGWISSDSLLASQAYNFIKKFLINHPKFLKNPLYIAGISYVGIVVPKVTLEVYEGNERGDEPTLNIQGYIVYSPLTHKFNDINSRLEYAHRMALISDDIYKSAIENCHGNYINIDKANSLCVNSLLQYEQCTSRLKLDNILEPLCDENDLMPYSQEYFSKVVEIWANTEAVQEAIHIRQGKIGKWEVINETLHYHQGKNDTFCYSYDIFTSFDFHKKLVNKRCQALIVSGDHDMTFPYVGVEQWIASLNLTVEIPWKPFYVDGQVGGYETKYVQDHYSLIYSTVKGAGHIVLSSKPKEAMALTTRWFSSHTSQSNLSAS